MALTDVQIRSFKPQSKPYKRADSDGMYMEVTPSGARYWRLKYRIDGREKKLSLGVYPEISLATARERRFQARSLIAKNIDPSVHRASLKKARQDAARDSFEVVAREWHAAQKAKWRSSHADKVLGRLEGHVFKHLGKAPVKTIKAKDILDCVRRIEEKGRVETAHRALNVINSVLNYAVVTQRAENNPTLALKGSLKPAPVRHHATITEPVRIGKLLRDIDGYDGRDVTRLALRLAPLVFLRPGELRNGEWSEIDLENAEWHLPASRMKMGEKHIVPLSTQAIAILKELKEVTGHRRAMFPGVRAINRPMSENTLNAALRYMGYAKGQMTAHGFRSMASTRLNEREDIQNDWIERQLAHAERNSVRAAYCYAEYLKPRRAMMQTWADMLDGYRLLGVNPSLETQEERPK